MVSSFFNFYIIIIQIVDSVRQDSVVKFDRIIKRIGDDVNKELIVSVICILLVISISLVIVVNNSYSNKTVLSDGKVNINGNNTSNMLTMMYEPEADSGEYQIASDTNWLSGDYVFNETLSRCENGSNLRWDDTTNRVIIEAATADKCYVYQYLTVKPRC